MQEFAPEEHITQDSSISEPEGKSSRRSAFWYLEGYVDERRVLRRVPLRPLPFVIGRKSDLPLTLNFSNISRLHAELYFEGGVLMVRDLDSRNGTFLNRERIYRPASLRPGDVVHFGSVEFRVGAEDVHASGEFGDTRDFQGVLPAEFITGTREFMELIRTGGVVSHFQPLVYLKNRDLFGYEALGRGVFPDLPDSPYELFRIAASVSLEEELSRLFRRKAVEDAARIGGQPNVFLNLHPAEMRQPKMLISNLLEFRRAWPDLRLTLEVHESLVTDLQSMRQLASELRSMDCCLAYDDFGAGQARLVELAEAPPDFLKFDRSLVRDLHQAPRQRQQMVEILVRFARDLGVTTLAEGIELEQEAVICAQLGFDCAQGYYFGKPVAVSELTSAG